MIVLRDYQEKIISDVRAAMKGGQRSVLITSPTGSGKTSLTAHMLKTASEKGMRCWFINHRVELIEQSANTFSKVGLRYGIVSPRFQPDPLNKVQICSIQSLARRHKNMPKPKLIVWDECAHIAAASWSKIYAAFGDSFHVGLTATPQRLDGKGLSDYFQKMVLGPSVSSLIDSGHLSKYRMFAPSTIDTSGVASKFGDFVKASLVGAASKPSITGHAITEYKKRALGKRAIAFCVSIEHSKMVAEQFRSVGISAEHVDGETDPRQRSSAMSRFRNGELNIICNVDLYGEGLDVESLEAVILLRPTQSLSLYLQQVGRALRPFPGKEYAIILDHAGNAMRHGLPDDDREWSLKGKVAGVSKNKQENPVKTCAQCFCVYPSVLNECPECHFVSFKPREVETVEGELVEVDVQKLRKERINEQLKANTEEELYQIGLKRGYKGARRWAKYVFQARQAKKLARGRP